MSLPAPRRDVSLAVSLLLALSLACNLGTPSAPAQEASPQPASRPTALPPPTATARPTGAPPPTEAPVDTPAPTPTVTHLIFPGEPGVTRAFMTDIRSATAGAQGYTVTGDNYLRNRFERPFTPQEMVYRPDLDILRGDLTFDDAWLYFLFTLEGPSPTSGGFPGTYAVELDTDVDGRGDWLIMAQGPVGTDWSTDGVQVWLDANDDVGGQQVMTAEGPTQEGDGYETLVFDQGLGDDPDAAWARLGSSAQVQVAVKRDLINDISFLWALWADDGLKDPARFDYHDRYSEEQAGSPLRDSPLRPLKEVALVDNTCRMYYGFTPTGSEPGLCAVFATIQNCTFHPMLIVPGNQIIGGQQTSDAFLQVSAPGTYEFYDQNVFDNNDMNPLVLTVSVQPGDLVQIVTDGNEMTWACP